MRRASAACRRLLTIPGVVQLTTLGACPGLVPGRYQCGEVDYLDSISKCGDRRVRTLLYEAANVMLSRYRGQLKLRDWAFAIVKRSTMRKAPWLVALPSSCMRRDGVRVGVSTKQVDSGHLRLCQTHGDRSFAKAEQVRRGQSQPERDASWHF
jgi:Transposase IS116/IS110/IS902 family